MTDELDPRLKDAIEELPRERMPDDLEAKVAGAMREHGFLERRRRVVAVTGGRVAGLVAACVALVIGAYSIGLHRGDGGDAILPATPAPQRTAEIGRADAPAADEGSRANEMTKDEDDVAAQPLREEKPDGAAPKAKQPALTKEPAPEAAREKRSASMPRQRDERADDAVAGAEEASPAPSAVLESVPEAAFGQAQPRGAGESKGQGLADAAPPVFMLNGYPVAVFAPDSVRVELGADGVTIVIHTSDGVIRIKPLTEN